MPDKPLLSRRDAYRILGFDENERFRNYELEHELESQCDLEEGEIIIGEWCPFNGIYCKFFDVAPIKALEEAKRNREGRPQGN